MPTARAIAEYHDFLVYVFLYAPDRFPEEDYLQPAEQMTLAKAFAKLVADLPSVRRRLKDKDKMELLAELLAMSHESYQRGDAVRGAHILQELEGLVWPKHRLPEEFAPEAAARLKERHRGVGALYLPTDRSEK